MAMINFTCPHCEREKMTFDITGSHCMLQPPHFRKRAVTAFCRSCQMPVALLTVFRGDAPGPNSVSLLSALNSPVDLTDDFRISKTWPTPPQPNIPLGITPAIARTLEEAEDNRVRRNTHSAATMFRRALELAMKELEPEISKGTFAARIRRLAVEGKLTADIADWADHVRILGNEAVHDDETPTAEAVDDLANLTRMILVYLFDLPRRVSDMRARAGQPDA